MSAVVLNHVLASAFFIRIGHLLTWILLTLYMGDPIFVLIHRPRTRIEYITNRK